MRCESFYFERSCPEQRPRAALKPQEPHSGLERALDPGRPRRGPARESRAVGRGVVVVWGRGKLQELSLSHGGWMAMPSGIKRCAFGRPVGSSALPHNARFPLRFGRDRLTSSQASQDRDSGRPTSHFSSPAAP
jgi:hypothetical protein